MADGIENAHQQNLATIPFYVLGGELEITIGSEKVRAKPGTFVTVPIIDRITI